MPNTILSISMDYELYKRLDKIARLNDTSKAEIVRRALEKYLGEGKQNEDKK